MIVLNTWCVPIHSCYKKKQNRHDHHAGFTENFIYFLMGVRPKRAPSQNFPVRY